MRTGVQKENLGSSSGPVSPKRTNFALIHKHVNLRFLRMHTLPEPVPSIPQKIVRISHVPTSLRCEPKGPLNRNPYC